MKRAWFLRTAMSALSVAAFLAADNAIAAETMDDLIAGAKEEGELTIIAVPHDWCKYGDSIELFKKKYPFLKLNELNPDAGSGDEIEAIKANKDNKGPQNPDVIDVGLSFGPSAKKDGLLQPYKVSTWDSIPEGNKDPEGYWYGNYYGVLAFEVNTDLIPNPPQDWPDLLKPEFKNESDYPRSVSYLRKDNGMLLKWDLFGKSNKLEKVITAEEIKQIQGFWTVTVARVDDLKKKGKLILRLQEGRYNPPLDDSLFSEDYLKQNTQ